MVVVRPATRSLVTTNQLAEALAGPRRPVLLDTRWRLGGPSCRDDYLNGHLPGAVFLELDTDLAAPAGDGGRHPLPEPAVWQEVLRAAGIRESDPVVAYDGADGSVAARAWWLLRWAGHTDVAVLDGGYAAWVCEGRPLQTGAATPEPGDIVVRPGAMPVLDAEQAAALARSGVLLDARAPERYRGDVEPVDPRGGHVPGARNAPFAGHTDTDGRWRSPGDLAERFADIGVRDGVTVGAYCGSGVTASSVVLALEVAGLTSADAPAPMYSGSWSHWCLDPNRPVATGEQPG
jgi:thiosulfate/3-mercaptopyruvate sulfurtransferase